MSAECSSCGAPILWAWTRKGARLPLDASPDPAAGEYEIVEPEHRPHPDAPASPLVAHVRPGSASLFETPPRYVSHWKTCPTREEHRRAA